MPTSTPEPSSAGTTSAGSHPLRGAIRHGRGGVLLALLLGITVGALTPLFLQHEYTATASVLVTPTGVDDQATIANARTTGLINMDNESRLVQSAGVVAIVRHRDTAIPRDRSVSAIEASVTVTVPANTSILQISYTAPNAAAAARLANDFAAAYLQNRAATARATLTDQVDAINTRIDDLNAEIDSLSRQLTSGPLSAPQKFALSSRRSLLTGLVHSLTSRVTSISTTAVGGGQVITTAVAPTSASSPSRPLWLAGGLAAGVVIALCVLWVNTSARRRLITPADVTAALKLPVIEEIPDATSGKALTPQALEHYRRLGNIVLKMFGNDGVLVVTTPGFDAFSAVFALNLADVMTSVGVKARVAATTAAGKLSEERVPFVAARSDVSVAHVTPEGFAELRAEGGITIIAGREPGSASDVQAVAALGDAVLLLMPSRVRRRDSSELLRLLDAVGAPVLGAVMLPRLRAWRHSREHGAPARSGKESDTGAPAGSAAASGTAPKSVQPGRAGGDIDDGTEDPRRSTGAGIADPSKNINGKAVAERGITRRSVDPRRRT